MKHWILLSMAAFGLLALGYGLALWLPPAAGPDRNPEVQSPAEKAGFDELIRSVGRISERSSDDSRLRAGEEAPAGLVSRVSRAERIARAQTLGEWMEAIDEAGENDRAARLHLLGRFADGCLEALSLARASESAREFHSQLYAFKTSALLSLAEFCEDGMPASMNPDDSVDTRATRELGEFLFLEGADTVDDRIRRTESEQGSSAAKQEARRLLAESLNETELMIALDYLVRQEHFEPPFPEHPGTDHMYHGALVDVGGVLLCDRIGGCPGDHPMTLLVCQQAEFGCYEPVDVVHAIEQTKPPMHFHAFASLLDQARSEIVRYRRSR